MIECEGADSELERLGAARVSTASGPARVAMTATRKIAAELLRNGSFDILAGYTMSHPEANALMAKRVARASTGDGLK